MFCAKSCFYYLCAFRSYSFSFGEKTPNMACKHYITGHDFFHHVFLDCRGCVRNCRELFPFDHTLHANLEKQSHVAVIIDYPPQFLFAVGNSYALAVDKNLACVLK